MIDFPATSILDPAWLRERLDLARQLYGHAPNRVLGTVWWYSTSAVLLEPPLQSLYDGAPLDPSLEACSLRILPDGRLLGAASSRPLDGAAGGFDAFAERLRDALAAAVDAVAAASGARTTALWAIATDSLAGRLLSAGLAAGSAARGIALAERLSAAVGPQLPAPRFAQVGPHLVVRRASCCLIDRIPGGATCASCPHQHPDERERRIRALLG